MFVIYVGIAAFIGGVVNAVLGWTQQKPAIPFDPRAFASSCIASLIGAAGIAEVFNYSGAVNPLALIAAFLAGAGVSAGASRISGSIGTTTTQAPTISVTTGTTTPITIDPPK